MSYYNGSSYSFTWEKGRKLSRVQKGSSSFEFTYDESGHRIQKTSYADPIQYVWSGDRLIAEYREGYDTTIYLYDASGSPIGFLYRDNDGYYTGGAFVQFFYEKNLQGDIVGIIDSTGNKFVSYHYDAWGNLLKMEYHGSVGSFQANMAESNPYRYRGYYYDRETGFYYLNSRYYDPAIGRFLNADGSINANGDLTGFNMYAYCSNNPVMNIDPTGESVFAAALTGKLMAGLFSVISAAAPVLLVAAAVVATVVAVVLVVECANKLSEENTDEEDRKKINDSHPGEYTVYTLKDEDGNVRYVGRTKNYSARIAQHQKPGSKTADLIPGNYISGLTYTEARGLEQLGIWEYNTISAGKNAINGIAQKNPWFGLYLRDAFNYVYNQVTNEWYNLMGT